MAKRGASFSEDEVRLLSLLVEGFTDEVAAARLGWTTRTLRRRLKSAMEKVGARSRIQTGFLLARSGWLPSPPFSDRVGGGDWRQGGQGLDAVHRTTLSWDI